MEEVRLKRVMVLTSLKCSHAPVAYFCIISKYNTGYVCLMYMCTCVIQHQLHLFLCISKKIENKTHQKLSKMPLIKRYLANTHLYTFSAHITEILGTISKYRIKVKGLKSL